MVRPRLAAFIAALLLNCSATIADADTSDATLDVPSNVQRLAQSGDPVVQVQSGVSHACALVQSGQVYCWGHNYFGQLANDTMPSSSAPILIQGLQGVDQITVGDHFACALKSRGRIFCWGDNTKGQLGNGTLGRTRVPVKVQTGQMAVQIAGGGEHTCMINIKGRIYCWGNSLYGRLGIGEVDEGAFPKPQRVLSGITFTHVSAGSAHTCAVARNGKGYCWGFNGFRKLGVGIKTSSGTYTPKRVVNVGRLTHIDAGNNHTCATRSDGVAFCWGLNNEGQLGLGDGAPRIVDFPTRVPKLFDAKHIDVGYQHTCALRVNGIAVCWGGNEFGELGNGQTTDSPTRVRVNRLGFVANVSAGNFFSCASTQDGKAYCWGKNTWGKLGIGEPNFNVAHPIRKRVKFPIK